MLANTRKFSTTLLISFAILIAVSSVAEASHDLQQREHVNLKRIVRKRAPQGLNGLPVPIGAAPIPDASSTTEASSAASSTAGQSSTTSSLAQSSTISSAESTVATSTTSGTSTGTESATSTTSETTSTSSTSTSTTAAAAVTPPPADNQGAVAGTTTEQIRSTRTLIKSVDASPTTAPAMTGAAATTKSNVLTIIIAVVASIGGVAILWTVFRKWKLGSSKKFEDRLQPIDWKSPSSNTYDDDGIVPAHRRHSGSSFTSGGHSQGGRPNLSPIPDHDFTAGPSNASPVGGYADLARGPSMRENRGYEFGVPAHSTGGRY